MIAHLDCSSGVSGDKFLGALLDAGAETGAFTTTHLAELAGQLAPGAELCIEPVNSRGIAAVGVRVSTASVPAARRWSDIRTLLSSSAMPDAVRDRALAVFETLALAEARVHGTTADDVHFHEVGALDSIVDVVGVCAGLHALRVRRLVATPVAVGSGTVETSHGALPVPAPATALLLLGVPVAPGPRRPDGSPVGELTTPTGAALVRTLADDFGACPAMTPARIGYGAGTRDIGSPNVCRVIIGEPATTTPELERGRIVLLETNLDHLSPEAAAVACEELLAEGALDVWQAPVTMKKGRAAFVLSVICTPEAADSTAERIVALTGTLGVRRIDLPRYVAERTEKTIDTRHGRVRVKIGPDGAEPRVRPSHDDIARIARERGLLYREVADELLEAAFDELTDL